MPQTSRISLAIAAAGCLALGGAAGWTLKGASTETVVHDYILAHPEILPQAMDNLRASQNATALAGMRGQLEKSWPGAVLGNPEGRVTMVEFTDYACGYCRASLPDVEALIAANRDLKVVIRELPILSPASLPAARLALAAAGQGRYAAFRKAMYAAGNPDATSMAAATRAAGLDGARAQSVGASPAITTELQNNLALAQQLGISGTPAWIAGDQMLDGMVGAEALARAVAAARRKE